MSEYSRSPSNELLHSTRRPREIFRDRRKTNEGVRERDRDIERREYNAIESKEERQATHGKRKDNHPYRDQNDFSRGYIRQGRERMISSRYTNEEVNVNETTSRNQNRNVRDSYHRHRGGHLSDSKLENTVSDFRSQYGPRSNTYLPSLRQNYRHNVTNPDDRYDNHRLYQSRSTAKQEYHNNNEKHNETSSSTRNDIGTLFRFNKTQIASSHQTIVDTFISLAKEAHPPTFSGKHLAMLFVGAKRYKIKYSDWQDNEDVIWNLLLQYCDILDDQAISNILNSLNKMRRHFFSVMGNRVKNFLLAATDRNAVQFNSQGIANTLLALDQMGLKWVDIDRGLQDKLLQSVDRNAVQFNSQEIANSMLAFDGMGIEVLDLKDITKSLLDTVTRFWRSFSSQDILTFVETFDHIGFYWQKFPEEFQSQFLGCIEERYGSLKSHESGLLILRLNRLLVPREILESFGGR